MRERDLFIDGRWRPAVSGRRLDINDPATGEGVLARGRSKPCHLFPGWRRRRDHSLELSGRHIRLESRGRRSRPVAR